MPDAFAFDGVVDAYANSDYVSNEVSLTGLQTQGFTRASISGGTLIKNGADVVDAETTVANGDTIAVRLTSSPQFELTSAATLTIGEFDVDYTVLTGSEADYGDSDGDGIVNVEDDDDPDAFSFTSVVDGSRTQVYTSSTVTVSGLLDQGTTTLDFVDDLSNANSDSWTQPPSVLRKNGAPTSVPTTIVNGDQLEIEVIAPHGFGGSVMTQVMVGNATEPWSVTTRSYGDAVAEGTLAEPWEVLGAFDLGNFPSSVDTTSSYYIVRVPNSYHIYARSMTDDVDLYVYSTSDFATTLLCGATLTGLADESCEGVGTDNDLYVMVDGSKTSAGALFDLTTEP